MKFERFCNLVRIICVSVCVFCVFIGSALSLNNLPSGYTELEYLQSTGTQYIDTGIKQVSGTACKFEIDFTPAELTGYMGGNGLTQLQINTPNGFVIDTKSNARVEFDGTQTKIYNDDVLKQTFTSGTQYSNYPLFLFALGYSLTSYAALHTKGKLYNSKFYDNNNTLVRNFIPVKRNVDSVLGMWDLSWDGSQYGVVDLGDLEWYSRGDGKFVVISFPEPAKGQLTLYCSRYVTAFTGDIANLRIDKAIGISDNGLNIWARDTTYGTDVTSFKNSLKGVKLYYQRTTDSDFHGPFYTNSGTGTFIAGPVAEIQIATTKYVESAFASAVSELNTTMGTIKNVVDNTIIQADRIGKLATGKQNRPAENCPDGAQCLLITEADGSLHWYPICNADGTVGTQSSN